MRDAIHPAGLELYADSVVEHDGSTYFLACEAGRHGKLLGVQGDLTGFEGHRHTPDGALLCPLSDANARTLRARLPWLNPTPLGLATSAGFGDRLGIATPGHVQALAGTTIAPVFAQQSVRENARTGRTPQDVLDDALWGAFQTGWRAPWGADADHLKTPDAVEPFVRAGYSFYTVDPSDHVDNVAQTDAPPRLAEKVAALPWDALDSSLADLRARFLGSELDLGMLRLAFDEVTLYRAAAKYGRAVAHVAAMFHHLAALLGDQPFDFEVSVDETDTPTSIHEHYYIAVELRRLGVMWVSLAPRFVGRFEKGVDFIGNLDELDAQLAGHAAVMRHIGGYKLSLHSGSDKFTVYPLITRHTAGRVHLKTAGTSYLEALRVWAALDPAIFREVLDFARGRYVIDRASYHVSAELARVPAGVDVPDEALPGLLDQFDARQVLHVTFGSVLDRYGALLQDALRAHEEQYYAALHRHFARHITPFAAGH